MPFDDAGRTGRPGPEAVRPWAPCQPSPRWIGFNVAVFAGDNAPMRLANHTPLLGWWGMMTGGLPTVLQSELVPRES